MSVEKLVAPATRTKASQELSNKTVRRLVAVAGQLQRTAEIDTPQEQMEALCAMVRSIREESDAHDLAEADPVAYMGKYINAQARGGDALHLCLLLKSLRAVDLADPSALATFYATMIEHSKARKRLSTDAPQAEEVGLAGMNQQLLDWKAQLRFLQVLEVETRARVSKNAADGLLQYVALLSAKVELVAALREPK